MENYIVIMTCKKTYHSLDHIDHNVGNLIGSVRSTCFLSRAQIVYVATPATKTKRKLLWWKIMKQYGGIRMRRYDQAIKPHGRPRILGHHKDRYVNFGSRALRCKWGAKNKGYAGGAF